VWWNARLLGDGIVLLLSSLGSCKSLFSDQKKFSSFFFIFFFFFLFVAGKKRQHVGLKFSTGKCSVFIISFLNFFIFLWPMPLFLLFNTQTMHSKSFYTALLCFPKSPGGILARVFLFLRRTRCPLRHAARGFFLKLLVYVDAFSTFEYL
jgi:hypothetical protein